MSIDKYFKKNSEKEKEGKDKDNPNPSFIQPSVASISISNLLSGLIEDEDYQPVCDLILSAAASSHVIPPLHIYNSLLNVLGSEKISATNAILIYTTLSRLLSIYSPFLCPLAWSPKSASDFDLVFNTLKTAATKGATSLGNYLLLVYIVEILEDDYKRNEEKKSQPRTTLIKEETEEPSTNIEDEPQFLLDKLVTAPGVDRNAKRLLVEAAMASLSSDANKEILGKKRKASVLNHNPLTEPSSKGEDDYMATAACMRLLEFVLYSNGGMEEQKFTIWSIFKTLHAYGKVNFLRLFANPALKLELLNFFLDNCNTPKDRNKEYNTKAVSHAKIILYFFNTNPVATQRKDDTPDTELFAYLIYHLVTTWIHINEAKGAITPAQFKELYEQLNKLAERLSIFFSRGNTNISTIFSRLSAICRSKIV
eukprot:Phypoly_transcript_09925.p1 GENE.Phypoly_transcript_09925~~Phypoly_transcript_09925.p1  ORF type:complete len:424 (+),score=77.79 Phypoly_transcript_09925:48-1319(+)